MLFLLDPPSPHLGGEVVEDVADGGELAGGVVVVVAEGGVDSLVGEGGGESIGEVLHDIHVDRGVQVIV